MATRDVFSDEELVQLRGIPEIGRAELIRHFTLAPADVAFLGKFRGRANVLGAAVQLCTLPWLGFVPDQQRRYPILLTLLAQSAVDVLDECLLLFDQALSGREAAAKTKVLEALAERARTGEDAKGCWMTSWPSSSTTTSTTCRSSPSCAKASGWNG